MNKIIVILFSVLTSISLSQQDSPFMKSGYIGYSFKNINFQPKGFSNFGGWHGMEADLGGMTFSYHQGQLREIGADSTIGNPKGSSALIGFKIGPQNWKLGYNSFTSMAIKPYVKVSGGVMEASNKVLDENISSFGLVFSPGLELKFSHLYINASYDAGFFMNGSVGGKDLNIGKGFIGGTTITIGIENAFDLLVPKMYSFKGYNVSKQTLKSEKELKYDLDRRLWIIEQTTTTITSYTPGERIMALVRPFWGVGPSYSYHPLMKRQAPTSMLGANLGIRFWYLMLDGFYEEGTMGLEDKVGKEEILTTFPVLRDYDFSSQVQAKNYGGRIGFNLSKVFAMMNFNQTDGRDGVSKSYVPFTRLNVFYTMGITEFNPQAPVYTYDNGESKLKQYQELKEITPDASNNPNFLPQKSKFSGWGGSIEVGAAYFAMTWYKYEDAAIANHMNYTVGANIPLGRLFHSARANLFL